MLDSK
jgi:polynucleotide 5'-kinase involved in rRNA processing